MRGPQKDITQKMLADYNDVFADIVNVLLFHGERVISAEELETAKDRSQYKADGEIHEQERDAAKLLRSENVTIALLGFEHQTAAERFMPVRQISYDGASYRAQLLTRQPRRIYPVITLVLYFGLTPWRHSRHLTDLLDIPKEFRPHVSDYEMKNLFEIAFLAPEQVQLFQSDFRYVADYLVQKRKTNRYVPSPDVIQHVDATLKLLSVLTNDIRFETVAKSLDREKKGAITMCTIVDQFEEKGRAEGFVQGKLQGIEQGERQGIVQGKLEGMTQVYYTKLHYSAEQIAREIGAPVAQIEQLIRQLQI